MRNLAAKIEGRTATIGVVGLGYVGLPLAIAFAREFRVVGYDTKAELIRDLQHGKVHVDDVRESLVNSLVGKSLFPTADEGDLGACDFIIVSVPTPLSETKEPDLGYVVKAAEAIGRHLRRGQFVILGSTSYPGTTRDILVPLLERTSLKSGTDFGVAYCPERIDPGNKRYHIANTPQVVGGLDSRCTALAVRLFSSIVSSVVPVSNCEAAEATKILENIFRAVNIALINEMALILDKMNINTWEVVQAASTKPYGFMEFFPGPGIGGHCIPLDPFYMSYRAKQFGMVARFIELSGEINEFMRFHAVNMLVEGLVLAGKRVEDASVSVFGLSYKKNIKDTRESPAKKIIEELHKRGCKLRVYDPVAQRIETAVGIYVTESSVEDATRDTDAVILLADHSIFQELNTLGFERWMREVPVIVDTRNILRPPPPGTIYLGLGRGRPVTAIQRS